MHFTPVKRKSPTRENSSNSVSKYEKILKMTKNKNKVLRRRTSLSIDLNASLHKIMLKMNKQNRLDSKVCFLCRKWREKFLRTFRI